MKQKLLIRKWIKLFNQRNAEELAELYHEDAINHQIPNKPVRGRDAIKQMFANEFTTADMTCIAETIYEDGEWVILEWKDPGGLRGCGFFHIFDEKIRFQRGYWDKLSFLKQHNLPIPTE